MLPDFAAAQRRDLQMLPDFAAAQRRDLEMLPRRLDNVVDRLD